MQLEYGHKKMGLFDAIKKPQEFNIYKHFGEL